MASFAHCAGRCDGDSPRRQHPHRVAVGHVASRGNPRAAGGHGHVQTASQVLTEPLREFGASSLRQHRIVRGLSDVSGQRIPRGALAVQRRCTLAPAGDENEGPIDVEAVAWSDGAGVLPRSSTPRVAVNCADGPPTESGAGSKQRNHVCLRGGETPWPSGRRSHLSQRVSDRSVRVDSEIHLPPPYPEGTLSGGA